ncbi:hypothetical protein JDV02_006899 [Purpureocillium takamizusanense]|uniref:Uncharacterized protein n=1 Tax=Purpureocillium takamizusanense TaxID=2060973 RepID=A0A9Q8QJM7_9HYPO|nr:uncharacterized protein JDV02_006899 [Purpureocillium takamizusanense]UNI20850.1 hypothetical protein JDV02_006899 [Purpureocillium takamizusanense]
MLTANDTTCPVQVPGYTHNGDCSLLCRPSNWKDITIFFLGNYGAHVATVFATPGQSSLTTALSLLLALCFPGAGVLTGLEAITSRALFAPTDLTRAARAGALCIVAKTPKRLDEGAAADLPSSSQSSSGGSLSGEPHRPSSSPSTRHTASPSEPEGIELTTSQTNESTGSASPVGRVSVSAAQDDTTQQEKPSVALAESQHDTCEQDDDDAEDGVYSPPDFAATQVQGVRRMPAGYKLMVLPSWTTFEDDEPGEGTAKRARIQTNYSVIKVLVSLGQLIFAVVTLYEARGNQIEVYGYAAFGLTVAPYIWMSFVNLLANLLCPQYSSMLLIGSPALDEMRRELAERGLEREYPIDGTVGRISADMEERVTKHRAVFLASPSAFYTFFAALDSKTGNVRKTYIILLRVYLAVGVAAMPIVIVGVLSRFKPGSSAASERVWTMMWLCLGPVVGAGLGTVIRGVMESRPVLWLPVLVSSPRRPPPVDQDEGSGETGRRPRTRASLLTGPGGKEEREAQDGKRASLADMRMQLLVFGLIAWFLMLYMVPAIGGFVVVGQMLVAYGSCTKID